MAVRYQRAAPLIIFAAGVVLGGAAGVIAAHDRGYDQFLGFAVGMAAGGVAATALIVLEPAWLLTAGLMLSVFSGNWGHMGIPIPLDRVAVVAGVVGAVASSFIGPAEARIRIRGVHWLMLALVLYAISSAAWAGTLTSHLAVFSLLDRLGLVPFLLYLVAPTAFRTENQRRVLLGGLVLLGGYLGLVTLFEAVGPHALVIPHYILNPALGIHSERGRGPFLEAGANGLALFMCLVAAVLLMLRERRPSLQAAAAFVIVLCVGGILFTLTRQTWVGAAGGAIAAMLANRRTRQWLPAAVIVALAVVAVAVTFVPHLSTDLSQRVADQGPVWDRLNSDHAALRMVATRPALGFGWGTFGTASPPYYRLASTYPLTTVAEVHNMPLSNAAELGIVGLVLWLGVVFWGLVLPATKRVDPSFEPWRLAVIAIGVAWFLQANLTPLDYAFDNYVPWLFAGILLGPEAVRSRQLT